MGIWSGVRTHLYSSSRIITDGIPEEQKTMGGGGGCAQLYYSTVNGKKEHFQNKSLVGKNHWPCQLQDSENSGPAE